MEYIYNRSIRIENVRAAHGRSSTIHANSSSSTNTNTHTNIHTNTHFCSGEIMQDWLAKLLTAWTRETCLWKWCILCCSRSVVYIMVPTSVTSSFCSCACMFVFSIQNPTNAPPFDWCENNVCTLCTVRSMPTKNKCRSRKQYATTPTTKPAKIGSKAYHTHRNIIRTSYTIYMHIFGGLDDFR